MAGETVTSAKVASTVIARSENGLNVIMGTYDITAATELQAGDIFQMVKVPKGAKIVDVILGVPELDTGTDALTLNVGDDGDIDRYIAVSTVGQAGGVARLSAPAGMGYTYTADNTVDIVVGTGAHTGATSGTIRLTVIYDVGSVA